ncbi:MAG: hypothetical protein WBA93_22690 [Microcoleaceae cyanobacterium]
MRKKYEEYNEVSGGKWPFAPTVENSPPPESATEIVVLDTSQEEVLPETLGQTIVEEQLPEIETVGNGEQELPALSVLVKLLRRSRQRKCQQLSKYTNIVFCSGKREPKSLSKPQEINALPFAPICYKAIGGARSRREFYHSSVGGGANGRLLS